jgi:FSR family fosmidomycin resistance protein-like MFS transporter
MKKVWALPLLWGILHGINDFISGFMLSHVMLNNHEYAFFLVILYAILAFGGQLPLGIWLDKRKQLSLFGITGITLLLFSIPIFFINNFAAIVITGLASAIIHIVGGSVCYIVNW